jgi:hypothetical protein
VKPELNVVAKRYGWRFFLKPVGLELFFLETGTYLYFLLFIIFYFLFFFQPLSFCWRQIKIFEEIDNAFRKGYEFLKQKKEISNLFLLFFCFKNPYSFLDLILWVLNITFSIFLIFQKSFQVIFNIYKNNEKIIPSAMR